MGRKAKKAEEKKETVELATVEDRKLVTKEERKEKFAKQYPEEGSNSKALRNALQSEWEDPIDTSDPQAVKERIDEYYLYCIEKDVRPQITGLANWLGVDRSTLNRWKRGTFRAGTHEGIIERELSRMEEIWSEQFLNGELPPAQGIFYAKNVFGMRDVVEQKVEISTPLGAMPDQRELEARIASDVIIEVEPNSVT